MKKSTYLAMAIAALLAGCARGGGIGLEAMVADSRCEQRGFHLGTPEYANCRAQIAYQRGMVNAGMLAYYQRQQEQLTTQMNRQQTCSYGGTTIGGITGGTIFNVAAVALTFQERRVLACRSRVLSAGGYGPRS